MLDPLKNCYVKTYRIINLFTFKEKCEKVPQADYILLFRTLYAKCEPCEMEDFEKSSLVQLSLVYRKNRRLIIHESRNTAEAFSLARELSNLYGLKIRDSATDRRNPVWIKN